MAAARGRDDFAGGRGARLFVLMGILVVLLVSARTLASVVINYYWWRELGQLDTWFSYLIYGAAPVAATALVAFAGLWIAHARALKLAGTRLRDNRIYARLSTLAILAVSVLLALVTIDTWAVVRWFGGRQLDAAASGWADPVFGNTLAFYFFSLPFYNVILRVLLTLTLAVALVYWLTARAWQLRSRIPDFRSGAEFELKDLRLAGALESKFLRVVGALFLVGLAGRYFLDRYAMLFDNHGFMVGVDWVDQQVRLPLQWVAVGALLLAAALVAAGMLKRALIAVPLLLLPTIVPPVVNGFYVKPNEISIQRPFVDRHIKATREAFGLVRRAHEVEYKATQEAPINVNQHKAVFDNVRLWDWRAFHDTISQIQALRPYYVFPDSDVDRYQIDGQLRQVLLAPRELDVRQLPDAQSRWINPHFIYTHGYGVVMAEASRITSDGLPVLFIQDAPPQIETKSLKLTRPEIYYGEQTHEPVFVHTQQPEFNYPSGGENVQSTYAGTGGFPISSMLLRLMAAVREGDWNIVLTGYFTPESRMMIHRNIRERLAAVAGFLTWDPDPYMVLTDEGRLVWMCDAYTTSSAHPYSQSVGIPDVGEANYIRNSVKATVDAYSGETRLYVFDPADPIINAYRKLFPAAAARRLGNAGRPAQTRPLPGASVPRAGRDVPAFPHARSGSLLQQRRRLGHRPPGAGSGLSTGSA